jgi:hypothetical protein
MNTHTIESRLAFNSCNAQVSVYCPHLRTDELE